MSTSPLKKPLTEAVLGAVTTGQPFAASASKLTDLRVPDQTLRCFDITFSNSGKAHLFPNPCVSIFLTRSVEKMTIPSYSSSKHKGIYFPGWTHLCCRKRPGPLFPSLTAVLPGSISPLSVGEILTCTELWTTGPGFTPTTAVIFTRPFVNTWHLRDPSQFWSTSLGPVSAHIPCSQSLLPAGQLTPHRAGTASILWLG